MVLESIPVFSYWWEGTCGGKWCFVQVGICTIWCPPGHCSGANFVPSLYKRPALVCIIKFQVIRG